MLPTQSKTSQSGLELHTEGNVLYRDHWVEDSGGAEDIDRRFFQQRKKGELPVFIPPEEISLSIYFRSSPLFSVREWRKSVFRIALYSSSPPPFNVFAKESYGRHGSIVVVGNSGLAS
ncbi:hypothetical protein RND71_011076 [Anisodus tanguticus]|uniref:Uncharacterized protein n=1 Tax=Anisodus tanguticus TaxID=243964 RepID=A0AAE1SMW0_9SOLA|nr:hypothetical protein RND71_011076 [Anisodus tanguticus]